MIKKTVPDTNVLQKFKWGGTTQEWEAEAERLSDQLESINDIKQDKNNK